MGRDRLRWGAQVLAVAGMLAAGPLALWLSAAPSQATIDLAAAEAQRGEWSRWRGPNGDGLSQEKNLLDSWPAEGPPLLWKVKGFGKGYSSLAVKGGGLFTMGKVDGAVHIIAAKASDGGIVWSTPITSGGNDPNCTPTVDGGQVFALANNGVLGCVDLRTGAKQWTVDFKQDLGGDMMSGWGYSESPLVDGNLVICTPGGNQCLLAALDRKTGKPVWKTAVTEPIGNRGKDGAGYASPVISYACGVKQYITLTGRGIVSVEAASGKLLWSYNDVANGTANIPTPLIQDDYVFCSSGYGTGSALLHIKRDGDKLVAEEKYFLGADKLQNHHGGMILKDGYVYCGHGHNNGFPVCIKLADGEDAWRPGRGAGKESAAIAYADGHLYFRYQDGVMALVEATPKEYILKGSFKIAVKNGNSWPHPVIAGGKLLLRDQNDLVCYDVRKKP